MSTVGFFDSLVPKLYLMSNKASPQIAILGWLFRYKVGARFRFCPKQQAIASQCIQLVNSHKYVSKQQPLTRTWAHSYGLDFSKFFFFVGEQVPPFLVRPLKPLLHFAPNLELVPATVKRMRLRDRLIQAIRKCKFIVTWNIVFILV